MKIYNIDYVAAEGQPIAIAKLQGFNSEDDATKALIPAGAVRLQARAESDLASLGQPIIDALFAFKAPKGHTLPDGQMPTVGDVWAFLNPPPPKERKQSENIANKATKASKKSPSKPLQSDTSDGKSVATGASAPVKPSKEGQMATKTKKTKKSNKSNGTKTGPRGEKTLRVKAMLERKSGCTRAQVLEETGWPAVSMQAMAKACGLKLRVDKEKGKPTQYFGS